MNRVVKLAVSAAVVFGALGGVSTIAKADPIVVPQDIVFLFDASGSLGSLGFQEELDLMSDIVATFANDPAHPTRFGAIRFDTTIDPVYNLTDDQTPSSVIAALQATPYTGGQTHTRDAVIAALQMFDDQAGAANPLTLILITDGNPFASPIYGDQSVCNDNSLVNQVNSRGIDTKIVGIGDSLDPPSIYCLVEDTVADFLFIESLDYADLELQQGYVLTAAVPEPASAALFAIAGIIALRRRRAAAR